MAHRMEIDIYYEDTDCGGVVYYANYLRYMERARTQYLASKGFSVKQLMDEGTVFMVLHAEIDYKSPGRLGDTIVIETSLSEVTRATLSFSHTMREATSSRALVSCMAKLVIVDSNGRPKRLPAAFLEKIR